jgi:hypothetical protein
MLRTFMIFLLFALPLFAANSAALNIAVNDLSGKGIEQSSAAIISDRLRSELISVGVFRVLERNEMATILKEQGFQRSGACDEALCLVEIGQLLGVERMVAGSVGKIGTLYTLSLRMINVATGQILFTVDEDYEGEIKGFLSVAVGNAAKRLAVGAVGEISRAAMTGKTGDLYILSTPAEASVELDGNSVAGKTPLTLKGIAAGDHRIVARKGDYYGSKSVTLTPDDLLKVSLPMERGKGSLKVFTTPDEATVLIDGELKGVSPCKIDNIPAGDHWLAIKKGDFLLHSSKITTVVDVADNCSISLVPAAYVTVWVPGHIDARIFVNGQDVEQGAIQDCPVPAGECKISVEKSGCEAWTKSLVLAQGTHESVTAELVSAFGTVVITSYPAGAKVFLNELEAGETPYLNKRLTPGKYKVQLIQANYDTSDWEFNIIAGERKLFEDTLISVFGSLVLEATPTNATFIIDEQGQYISPCKILPGIHTIAIEAPGYATLNDSIRVVKNNIVQKSWVLLRSQAYIDSVDRFAQRTKSRRQWTRRIVFGSIAAGSAGTAGFFNFKANRAYDQYSALSYSDRIWSEAYWKKVDNYRKMKSSFYIAASVFTVLFTISIPF